MLVSTHMYLLLSVCLDLWNPQVCTHVFFFSSSSNPSYPCLISGSSRQTTHLFSQHRLLGKECPWIFSSGGRINCRVSHFQRKKMFRLGGISLIREMRFAEKNEWQKKKIPISLLAGNSERKLWGLMKSFVFDYEIFSKQVFESLGLMHGHRNLQLHMLVRRPWLDKQSSLLTISAHSNSILLFCNLQLWLWVF